MRKKAGGGGGGQIAFLKTMKAYQKNMALKQINIIKQYFKNQLKNFFKDIRGNINLRKIKE